MTANQVDFAEAFARPSWSDIERALTEALTTSGNPHFAALDRLLRDHGYTRSRESDVQGFADLLRDAERRAGALRGNE